MDAQQMRRGEILVFLAALIGVPVISVLVIADTPSDAAEPLLRVALPAAIGSAIGLLMIAWSQFGNPYRQTSAVTSRRELGATATALITGAALLGSFSGHLPDELVALLSGWTLGFFAAFDVLIARRWRQDPAFRARIRDGLSGSS